MTAAHVERPHCDRPLIDAANRLMEHNPGYRVEIIGGILVVTPPPDIAHSRALNALTGPFVAAGLGGGETEVHQGIGVWLPDGPEDFAIPDLSIVDADADEHLVENNCYDPAVFRLVLEVTSSNYQNDLRAKVTAYAIARIPVYVIVNRRHNRLHVLTEPVADEYDQHQVFAPGQSVTLPASLGAEVTLDVGEILAAGRAKSAPGQG
ncbi:Uma2 family endonuclease [Streptomyces sp. ISL-12]|uniref:Uma2 family endonuclease n=1 Tax=Streptomyces sp. ISL-12 TaxID=2819177 RepID=UPI001BED0013|nr:Uma2 family endonuclease [Streptomyces sp. ISL-12]MBT2412888.1 Uma2 family endonuclease [Streptomyces sp. ISL-12]